VVGQNLRDQKDRAIRNRKLNHLITDVELPVGPSDLTRRPIDEQAVREVFDRLQFRTLLERVLKLAAAEGGVGETAAAPAGTAAPVIRTVIDEELGTWLVGASAAAPVGAQPVRFGGELTGFGLATAHETVFVPWAAD